jgi:hypothetical protein
MDIGEYMSDKDLDTQIKELVQDIIEHKAKVDFHELMEELNKLVDEKVSEKMIELVSKLIQALVLFKPNQ